MAFESGIEIGDTLLISERIFVIGDSRYYNVGNVRSFSIYRPVTVTKLLKTQMVTSDGGRWLRRNGFPVGESSTPIHLVRPGAGDTWAGVKVATATADEVIKGYEKQRLLALLARARLEALGSGCTTELLCNAFDLGKVEELDALLVGLMKIKARRND